MNLLNSRPRFRPGKTLDSAGFHWQKVGRGFSGDQGVLVYGLRRNVLRFVAARRRDQHARRVRYPESSLVFCARHPLAKSVLRSR
jgi:hypothetical protein